jgi:hypothetical protein
MAKGRTKRREVPPAELAAAREVAQRQVANAVRRELLEEHWSAMWPLRAALIRLRQHDDLDSAADPSDSRVQLSMALDREEARVTRELSVLIDDSYGIAATKRSPDGVRVIASRPRPFDALECAPEYERGEDEDRDAARRRAEGLATLRILVERGHSPRAAVAALDPKQATVKSRELPGAPVKRAERARDERQKQLRIRLEKLEQQRADIERDNGSKFQHIRRAPLPRIDQAIAWVKQQIAQDKK